ncbi:hypothetical protein [Acinetobacter puyangensis]|uniref:hypothetical protein n=1 Tax=Acinetobacter puyangensis TaxID=1096779 RepID=UPI003A4D23B8
MNELTILLSNTCEFKRKEVNGNQYSLLYGTTDGDIQYSILLEYLDNDLLRDVTIRGKYQETVAFLKMGPEIILDKKFLVGAIFKNAYKRIKMDLMRINAPEWAKYWVISESGQAWWLERDCWEINLNRGGWSCYALSSESGNSKKAPTFGYSGDWRKSLTAI